MWIESHQSIRNHPKFKKAARLCGINEFEMIGRVHCLWWWALDYAPDGDITKYSVDDIESAVDWTGEHGKFYRSLIDCGFSGHTGLIDELDGVIVIHDWHTYAGKLIDRRLEDAERKRQNRMKKSEGHPEDGAQTARVPNQPTVPTEPTNYGKAVAELEKKFSALTGIPLPPRETDRDKKSGAQGWWNPLGVDIYKNLCAEDLSVSLVVIENAVKRMRADGLTISAPRSIVKVAASERGKLNGQSKSDEAPRKVYQ